MAAMENSSRPLPVLRRLARLGALVLGLTSSAAAQGISYYCDCDRGLGPCGNGITTDVPGGCLNSLGVKAFLFPNGGTPSVAADDLVLVAGNLPAHQLGLVYMGAARTQVPFGDGLRCVAAGGAGLFRFPVADSGDDNAIVLGPGIVAHSLAHFPPSGHIHAGQTWHFQGWYRDPAGPCGSGFNLTSALSVEFGP